MQPNNVHTAATHHERETDYDVIVVGGGPAGSTVATLLTKWGRRVLVLEKDRFPRHHIGESLLPGTMTLMKQLGVFDKVDQAGFVHKFGATYIWGKSVEPWTIRFSEVSDEATYSFQVERSTFDKLLLDHSRAVGATVREESRVIQFLRQGERIVGVRYVDAAQQEHTVTSRFCIDASGQSALLGTEKKQRRFNQTLRNFALYTYYTNGKPATDLLPNLRSQDRGNIFVVAMDKGWIWYIPLGGSRYSVGVVTHASLAKNLSKERRYQFYQNCLNSVPQMCYLLNEAQPETTNLYSQSDWSYVCDSFKGTGYLQVGDAACFVDPILSTGVSLAMEGAFRAALAINTSMITPELTEHALEWYEKEYKTQAGHFLQLAEHWYHGHRTRDAWFWKAKQLVDASTNLSLRQAFILLTGGFVTGAGDQDLPALQPFGGFQPFQLRTIYENLDNGITKETIQKSAAPTRGTKPAHHKLTALLTDNFAQACFSLKPGISYHTSMLEQKDHLIEIIKIIQDREGVQRTRLILPTSSQTILECIDGKRSTQEIVEEVIARFAEASATEIAERKEKVLSILIELVKNAVLEPVVEK